MQEAMDSWVARQQFERLATIKRLTAGMTARSFKAVPKASRATAAMTS